MNTHKHILDQLPSLFDFDRWLGLPERRSSNWKTRDSIPAEFWEQTAQYCRKHGVKGVTVASLREYARSKKDKASLAA